MKAFNRVICYLLGMFLIAAGTAFSLNSKLGVSPVNSFPIAISKVSSIDKGICVTIVFLFYVLVQFLLLRKNFKLKNLLQIVFSTIFGWFVTFTSSLLGDFAIPTYAGQLAMLAISILLISIGLIFYLTADIVPMPMEGMVLATTQKLKKFKFHNVKVVFDCISVSLAAIVALVFTGTLLDVREGTILSALLIGKVMGLLSKYIKPWVTSLCFGNTAKEAAS